MRTILNLDQFYLVHWQMKTSSSKRSWDPIRLKIIAVVNEGAKVVDICTTLMGLSDVASDGSPLFAEPMSLFGWACVTLQLTACLPSDWVAWIMLCVGNFHYSIDSYKIFLHTHCFGYPEFVFPFKSSFPIILFSFLETNVYWNQSSYAMNVR